METLDLERKEGLEPLKDGVETHPSWSAYRCFTASVHLSFSLILDEGSADLYDYEAYSTLFPPK